MTAENPTQNISVEYALFDRGFRPFFLGAGLFAAIAMPIWVALFVTGHELPSSFSPRQWHLHEMIFGYVPAVIAGFLLTAVPNWTGRKPIVAMPLMVLSLVWLSGRIAVAFSEISPLGAAIIDSAFLVMFALLMWREILGGNNRRNLPVCVILSLLAFANIAFHFQHLNDISTDLIERAALGVIAMLLLVIGARITPSFTNNWLRNQGIEPKPQSGSLARNLDRLSFVAAVVAIFGWVMFNDHIVVGWLLSTAAILTFIRMSRWNALKTFKEPLVLVLHIGQMWLPLWLLLMAAAILFPDSLDQASALHALSAGAIGTMTLAVMTRASLGHSGRPLKAGAGAVAIYLLVIVGALIRVIAQWLPFDYANTIAAGGVFWSAGFVLFVILWTPLLITRRK